MTPGNKRLEWPGRGEENHLDATKDARARWTEGARARRDWGLVSRLCGEAGSAQSNP